MGRWLRCLFQFLIYMQDKCRTCTEIGAFKKNYCCTSGGLGLFRSGDAVRVARSLCRTELPEQLRNIMTFRMGASLSEGKRRGFR